MPQLERGRLLRLAAGYAVFVALVAALTAVILDFASPAYRAAVVRVAVLVVTGIGLRQLHRYFRGDAGWDPPSDFDAALTMQPAVPKLDREILKLRKEVENSLVSRSFFDDILWPRLRTLAAARGERDLPTPKKRSWRRRRGRAAIAALVARIEAAETGR